MSEQRLSHHDPLHKQSVLALLDRPIGFHRIYATLAGGAAAGLMLSQAVYWTRIKLRNDPDSGGWFWKTQAEWEEETALVRSEQEAARKRLRQTTFWHEVRRGLPAKLYFCVDLDALAEVILQQPTPRPLRGQKSQQNHQNAQFPHTSLASPSTLDGPDPANQNVQFQPTITETTPETTFEISPEMTNKIPSPSPAHTTPMASDMVGVAETVTIAQKKEATTTDRLMAGTKVTPFEAFADAYPHHQGRWKARAEWDRQQLDATLPAILEALSVTREGALPRWPHVYLENKGWLDARHRPAVWPTTVVDVPRCCQCDEAPGVLSTRRCDVHAREHIRAVAVELCQIAAGGRSPDAQGGLTRVLEDLHPGQSEHFMAAIDWAQPQTVDTVATIIEGVQQQVIRQARTCEKA